MLERKHVKAKSENYFLSLISLRDWLTNGALMLLDRRRSHGQRVRTTEDRDGRPGPDAMLNLHVPFGVVRA